MKYCPKSNNANLKPLIKQILLHYIKQKQFKTNIINALHKHFEVVPASTKGNRVRRSVVFSRLRDELNLSFAAKSPELYFIKEILKQNNVFVVKIEGIKYYKGLRTRDLLE